MHLTGSLIPKEEILLLLTFNPKILENLVTKVCGKFTKRFQHGSYPSQLKKKLAMAVTKITSIYPRKQVFVQSQLWGH